MKFIELIKTSINKVLALVISVLLTVMTLLVLWQVFTRYIMNNPSTFTEELVIIILVWTSFLGAAYAFGTREHMALIFLKNKLTGKKKKALTFFIDIVVLFFVWTILIRGGLKITMGVMATRTPILRLSKSVIYSSTLVSGIIIAIFQIVNILEDILMSKKGVE